LNFILKITILINLNHCLIIKFFLPSTEEYALLSDGSLIQSSVLRSLTSTTEQKKKMKCFGVKIDLCVKLTRRAR